MLSPQSKTFLFNSPKKSSSKQSHIFLAKTCSSTAIRSQQSEQQQISEIDEAQGNYSKLLKQKDLKILNLIEKVKTIEGELSSYKKERNSLSSDLIFFKSKIQEEFYRSTCLESEIEIINTTLKNYIVRIVNLLQGNEKCMQSFAKHLQSLRTGHTEQDQLQTSKQLMSTLDFQITELTKSFYLLKRDPEEQRELVKSADLKLQSYKIVDQIEKQALRNHISQLIDYYETKMIDSDDFKQDIQNLRNQREYIKELLISSEKDRNQFANQIYEIARKEYQVDFQRMNKSDVVKFCLALLAKLKDLEHDRAHLQSQIQIISTTQKEKYEKMLKLVKTLEKGNQKKVSIKRLNSMPYH